MADRAKAVMGSKKKSGSKKKASKKKGGKKLHELRVRHTANGRYNVDHFNTPEASAANMPDETHGVSDMDELQQHMADHMQAPQQEEAAEMPQGGAPQGGM